MIWPRSGAASCPTCMPTSTACAAAPPPTAAEAADRPMSATSRRHRHWPPGRPDHRYRAGAAAGPAAYLDRSLLLALPGIKAERRASMVATQQTMATLLAFGFGQSGLRGRWPTTSGRRPVLLVSLPAYLLSSGGGHCDRHPGADPTRIVQGAAMSGAVVVARAMVRDLTSPARACASCRWACQTWADRAVPACCWAASVTGWFGWRASFVTIALIVLSALLFVALRLPETIRRAQSARTAAVRCWGLGARHRHPTFLGWSGLTAATLRRPVPFPLSGFRPSSTCRCWA